MLCFVSLCSIGGELQAIFSCRERKRLGVSQVLQQKLTEYHFHQKYGFFIQRVQYGATIDRGI